MQLRPAPEDFALRPRRRRPGRAAIVWSALFGAMLLGGVFALEMPHAAADPAASPQVLQRVVRQQLDALSKQDAGQAFALADQDLRTQFGNADAFLAAVRDQYPMLMHPASLLFLKPRTDGSVAMQKVRLIDDAGSSWSLTYVLDRQQDNQWRIAGCVVAPEGKQVLT